MKKHIFRTMAVMLLVCLGLTAFAACTDPNETGNTTQYTVTYVAGEGTGTAPKSEKHAEGDKFTVAANTFTYEGHTFVTWNDGQADVAAGATYTMPAKNVTFTAKWEAEAPAEKVTVTYSLGEYTTGTAPAAEEVEKGGEVTLPAAPAWEGYDFTGWQVEGQTELKQAGEKITVSANTTVTAQWEKHTPPMDGTWTANAADNALFGGQGTIDVEAALKKVGKKVYAVLRGTQEGNAFTAAYVLSETEDGWAAGDYTLTISEDGSKITVGGLGADGDKTLDLTGRTEFAATLELTGAYTTEGENPYFVDFDYEAIDLQTGYYVDAEFVTIGNYVVAYVDDETAIVFEKAAETLVSYSKETALTFTAAEAREKAVSYTTFVLSEEDSRIYLTVNGEYTGFTPNDLLALQEDGDIDTYNISVFLKKAPWSIYPNTKTNEGLFVNRELTIEEGTITAKFDVTDLPIVEDVGYGVAAQNNGSGDLAYVAGHPADYEFKIGTTIYTLNGNVGNVVLNVVAYDPSTDWTGVTATPTDITMALNETSDKVLLTITGTYEGTTQAHMEELLSQQYNSLPIIYFWGPDNNTQTSDDIKITVTENTWTIVVDITGLLEDNYTNVDGKGNLVAEGTVIQNATPGDGINGREGTSPGISTEFHLTTIADSTVNIGEKYYTLIATGLYGHNTIYVGTPVTLTYDLWEDVDLEVPAATKVAKSASVVLAEAPARDGYDFLGWKVGEAIKQPGERLEMKADTTVTAQWKKWPQPKTDYMGKWTGKVNGAAVGAPVDECDIEIDILATDESATLVIKATASDTLLVSTALYIPASDRAYGMDNVTLELVDGTLTLANFVAGQNISLTEKAEFGSDETISVTGVYTAADGMIYIDVDYGAIDLGEGYLADADFVNVGKYLVPLVEMDGMLQGTLVLEKEGDNLISYWTEGMKLEFTPGTVRAKTYGADKGRPCTTWTFDVKTETVDEEGTEKVYLYVSGTYDGYTASDFLKLCDDTNVNVVNISVYPNVDPWKPIYPDPRPESLNMIERTITASEGRFTAKLDITSIPAGTYGIASQNNGYGDLGWGANKASEATLGDMRYNLGNNGANVQLSIGKAVDVIATSVTIGLNEDETRVLLTIKGTYANITKAEVEAILNGDYAGWPIIYFWGASKGQKGTCTATVEENGTWTVVVDITDLEDDGDMAIITGYFGPHKLNNTSGGTEFHYDWVQDASVECNGKVYSLKKAQAGWPGHNCVSVKPAAAAE